MTQIKCYSVRLQSLVSISEKAYKAVSFDGSTAIIPKSQVFGQDYDVTKSEAYWISSWILEQKKLQYSTKKMSFFDKEKADFIPETGVTTERHIPEEKEPVKTSVPVDMVREYTAKEVFETGSILTVDIARSLVGKTIVCTSPESKYNQCKVNTFVVGDIISEWEHAAGRAFTESDKFANYQQYWASYMSHERIAEKKRRLVLLSTDGKVMYKSSGYVQVDDVFSGSDADREVSYILIG